MGRRIWMALGAVLCGLMANDGYREQKLKQHSSPACDWDWVKDSDFWSSYFYCGSQGSGGGGSGAGLDDDVTPSERAIDLSKPDVK